MDLLGAIQNVLNNINNGIGNIVGFFKGLFTLIKTTIQFIPQPFLSISLTFMTILTISIVYKVIRG